MVLERARSPSETYALIEPHFMRLGISRVARQTGLDRIGLPCFAAIRPNSRSLATHYGKGLSDAAARTAAAMEAVEFAIAEEPNVPMCVSTLDDLVKRGADVFDCKRLLPLGEPLDRELELVWVTGRRLATGAPVFVPADAVTLGDAIPRLTDMAKTTNGLASGNNVDEAIQHGLCELIERDALTLWSLQDEAAARSRCFAVGDLESEIARNLHEQLVAAGLQLTLFDLTTDIGVPVVHALVEERSARRQLFDVSAGTSCHPDSSRAAIGAITEAVQSRLTNIAGSRDDYSSSEYTQSLPLDLGALLDGAMPAGRPPRNLSAIRSVEGAGTSIVAALAARGIDDVVAVELGGTEMGVAVVRLLSGQLEDCLGNVNWWPGRRALAALGPRN